MHNNLLINNKIGQHFFWVFQWLIVTYTHK